MEIGLIVKKNNKIIKEVNLGDNFDKEFVKNLNTTSKRKRIAKGVFRVGFKEFFVEYWKCLVRNQNLKSQTNSLEVLSEITDPDTIIESLMCESLNPVVMFFGVLTSLCEYTKDFDLEKFDEKYELFVEVY